MHKDISGVLIVSTCLLNRDRNSVSDFTETPPPHRATCVLLYLTSPLPACDSAADNPHLEKKNMFSEMSSGDGGSSRLELLVDSLAGTSACLPFLPLHPMNIGYPHCEINNAFSYFFPSQDVGNSIASVKPASSSKLSKVKGLCIFFSLFCQRKVRSCQRY